MQGTNGGFEMCSRTGGNKLSLSRFVLLAVLSVLSGCSTFIDSDEYRKAVSVVRYQDDGDRMSLSSAAGESGGSKNRAASMLIRRRHSGLYDSPETLINYLFAVREELSLYRQKDTMFTGLFTDNLQAVRWYLRSNFAHTQQQPQFKDFPGKDPWGQARGELIPEYKKLLPSEMFAMSMYTGGITGKCTTLSAAVAGILSLNEAFNADPDDIVLLRTDGHTFGLWRQADGIILTFNNMYLDRIGERHIEYLRSLKLTHMFGFGFYSKGEIAVPEDLLTGTGTLRAMFERSSALQATEIPYDPELTAYALQKRSVPEPVLYVKVSAGLPHTQRLASKLRTIESVLEWMRKNLSDGSIFPDGESRIMTSDEVIVFKTGNRLDKAVLLCAILESRRKPWAIDERKGTTEVRIGAERIDMKTLGILRP